MRKSGGVKIIIVLLLAVMLLNCGEGDTTNTTNTYSYSGYDVTNANLSYLALSSGSLNPSFSPSTTSYTVLYIGDSSITVTIASAAYGASLFVNGEAILSGTASRGINLNSGQNTITIQITAPDGFTTKSYIITVMRISQDSYVKASNTGASDNFGYSVALSGDTLAVGAHGEDSSAAGVNGNQADNSATDSGAVYVFTRTGVTWVLQAYIKASNTGAGDVFGASVALSGDTLAVGAYYEDSSATGVNGNQADNGATDSGAVYVFTRTGSTWTQQAYIKSSNTGFDDRFGLTIAFSGDTLAVGVPYEDSGATGVNGYQVDSASDSGAVYVFTRTGLIWTQQAYIKASNTGVNESFGYSVALSGDTLAVGAVNESSNATGVNGNQMDDSAPSSGAVYVFTRTGSTWTQQAYIKASNTKSSDNFGFSVVLSGDALVVGAINESSSGSVYLFTRSGSTWTQSAYIKASNGGSGDVFGASVSLSGDTLVVGAYGEDNNAVNSGAVYVFR